MSPRAPSNIPRVKPVILPTPALPLVQKNVDLFRLPEDLVLWIDFIFRDNPNAIRILKYAAARPDTDIRLDSVRHLIDDRLNREQIKLPNGTMVPEPYEKHVLPTITFLQRKLSQMGQSPIDIVGRIDKTFRLSWRKFGPIQQSTHDAVLTSLDKNPDSLPDKEILDFTKQHLTSQSHTTHPEIEKKIFDALFMCGRVSHSNSENDISPFPVSIPTLLLMLDHIPHNRMPSLREFIGNLAEIIGTKFAPMIEIRIMGGKYYDIIVNESQFLKWKQNIDISKEQRGEESSSAAPKFPRGRSRGPAEKRSLKS